MLLLATGACAAGEVTDVHPPGSQAEAVAPRSAYVPLRGGRPVSKRDAYKPGDGLTVFLNPRGGTYRAGPDDAPAGTSSVVASSGRSSVTMPSYGGRADWDKLVDCVHNELGSLQVNVTDQRPASGDYVEIAVGGDGSELGMKGYAGVAPIDTIECLPLGRAVGFVFADKLNGLRDACEATIAEIGHVATLDHSFDCSDPTSYLSCGGADRHLQTGELECGEESARPCVCGRATQSPEHLLANLLGINQGPPPIPGNGLCGDVTYAGTCSPDGVLTWCGGHGTPRTLDCAAHGLGCGDTGDAALGNDCIAPTEPPPPPDACMGIDFLGQCSGAGVLTYCLDGALVNIDCAAIGQQCTFVDDTVGYYCTNPPAPDNCGAVTFFGECSADGNVLTYCSNGTLRVVDCSAGGLVCGLIDSITGNGCIEPPPPPPPATP